MVKTVKHNRIKDDKSVTSVIFKIVLFVLLIFFSMTIIVSFAFAFMTSFKTAEAFETDLLGLPIGESFTFNNYIDVFTVFRVKVKDGLSVGIMGMILNSIIYSVGGGLLATAVCCVTAYAVVRFNNWLSRVIYTIVIVCMALPIVGSLPSELQMLINLNLYDTQIGLVLLSSSFLGMHFLILHASFKSLPSAYAEAARIDGAGEWRIFLTIMLPLVKFSVFTVFLLKFFTFWNNYETPLIHTPDRPVLAYGLFRIFHNVDVTTGSGIRAGTVPHKIAASMIVLIPVLLVFLFTHKHLLGNVSVGGIKG